MTNKELQSKYNLVFEFLSKSRVKDALDKLSELSNECKNTDFKAQIERHSNTYLNMLKYAFELSDDPQKEIVYQRLVKEIMELADDIREDLLRSHQLLRYYQFKINPETLSEQVVTDIAAMVDRLTIQNESHNESPDISDTKEFYNTNEYKENIRALFRLIWLSDKFKDTEIRLIKSLIGNASIAWYDKCIVVSALTMSLIRHFDSTKIDLLFGFYDQAEDQIWQRAITGLVIGLAYHNERIGYYPEIMHRLKSLQGNRSSNRIVELIIQQMIICFSLLIKPCLMAANACNT